LSVLSLLFPIFLLLSLSFFWLPPFLIDFIQCEQYCRIHSWYR
jgi:hypothetical protein